MTLISFDREHTLATLHHLHEPGTLIELRHKSGSGMLGYFSDDPNRIAEVANCIDAKTSVYITLNTIDPRLAELGEGSTVTTKNGDIIRRRWFFVDFDPVRDKDTASTDGQFIAAQERAEGCTQALAAMGWPAPTMGHSGNGVHLLWAVETDNSPETATLFQRLTGAVAHKFGDAVIGVDKVVHNAARIIKLWGTKSVKGEDSPETPLRYSQAVRLEPRVIVTESMMRSVIAAWSERKPVTQVNNPNDPDAPPRKPGRPRKQDTEQAQFDMAAWLSGVGITVREAVEEADRTRFVLTECVFNPEHGGKDAAVFLGRDGRRGYHCFHDSCADRTWSDVRALFDRAYADRLAVTEGDLPALQVNERRAVDVVNDTVRLMAENNDPPTLFQSEGQLLTLRTVGDALRLVPLSVETLRVEAIRRISFITRSTKKDGTVKDTATWPSRDLLQSVLGMGVWDSIPVCEGVTEVPLVATDGTIHSTQGYSPATRAYLTTDEFAFRRDLSSVSGQEAMEAARWILDGPLEGFPFVDRASRAHALGAMVQHSVNRLINANTPLYFLDASLPGSGKGLLGEAISRVSCGFPTVLSLPVREEERQKTIVSTLLQRPTHVIWDNIKGQVDSPALEALLTAPTYSARLLGQNDNVALSVRGTTWMLTGNNATFSPDLTTRSVYIRLEPQTERPQEREDFRIPNLSRWIGEHRAEMVDKVMTIVAHWVGQGMPLYSGTRRHRLERWRDVIGGILESVGMGDAFLANTDALRESADTESAVWDQFVEGWLDKFQCRPVTVGDLMPVAFGEVTDTYKGTRSEGPLETLVAAPTDSQRKVRLGLMLKAKNGAIFIGHRIAVKTDRKRGNVIRLERVSTARSVVAQIVEIEEQIGEIGETARPHTSGVATRFQREGDALADDGFLVPPEWVM